MKVSNLVLLSLLKIPTACAVSDLSSVNDARGVVKNDLPKIYLSCSETVNGADVLDGAKVLTVFKDQFNVYSAEVVQKDQFSGNQILALLNVTYTAQTNNIDVRQPIELYSANEAGAFFKFDVYQHNDKLTGELEMTTAKVQSGVHAKFRCDKPTEDTNPQSSTTKNVHTLWSCQGQQGNATILATVKRDSDGLFSGTFTKNIPNANGSVRFHTWDLKEIDVASCGGFLPCDSITKDSGNTPGTPMLVMFVNYNNSLSTTGSGHLNFSDHSVTQIDASVGCSRGL